MLLLHTTDLQTLLWDLAFCKLVAVYGFGTRDLEKLTSGLLAATHSGREMVIPGIHPLDVVLALFWLMTESRSL